MSRPLRTSADVYHRVRWDPRFDPARFELEVDERLDGLTRIPLLAFVPGGRIPWSRVLRVLADGEVVWDREARQDRIFGSGQTPEWLPRWEDEQQPETPEPAGAPRPLCVWRAGQGEWAPDPRPGDELPQRSLRVVTWNVLREDLAAQHLAPEERWPRLLSELQETEADLVALQEVSPPLLVWLLRQDWLRQRWWVSQVDPAQLEPYGQLLLGHLQPRRLRKLPLTRDKQVLLAEFGRAARWLSVAAVHLPSQLGEGSAALREAHLVAALGQCPAGPAVLLGDVNCPDELLPARSVGFADPPTPPTFDRVGNALASRLSAPGVGQAGPPLRYDRILTRGLGRGAARLLGEAGPDGLPPSDHYGLCLEVRLERAAPVAAPAAPRDTLPVVTSALCLVPPRDAWPPLQEIRAAGDRSYARWPPHINLLYPFLPEAALPAVLPELRRLLARIQPFHLTLSELDHFTHSRSSTLWLRPDAQPADALSVLYRRLSELFPQCRERRQFRPHLSLGQVPGKKAHKIAARQAELESRWRPLSFEVRELALLTRREDEPFELRQRLPLAGEPLAEPSPLAVRAAPRHVPSDAALRAAVARLEPARQVLAGSAELVALGSQALVVADEHSDVDLLLVSDDPRPLAEVYAAIAEALPTVATRAVLGAQVPRLELALVEDDRTVAVDLLHVRRPPGAVGAPQAWSEATRASLSPGEQRATQGALEVRLLRELLEAGGLLADFTRLLPLVRAWARARGLTGQSWGLLGGWAWSLLTAWALGVGEDSPPALPTAELPDLLERCARRWASFPWDERPLCLTAAGAGLERADALPGPLRIASLTAPVLNVSRTVTPGTAALLCEEWRRLEQALRRGASWNELSAPPELDPWPQQLTLSCVIEDPRVTPSEARGWLLGEGTRFLLELERHSWAPVRPLPHPAGELALVTLCFPAEARDPRPLVRRLAARLALEVPGARLMITEASSSET